MLLQKKRTCSCLALVLITSTIVLVRAVAIKRCGAPLGPPVAGTLGVGGRAWYQSCAAANLTGLKTYPRWRGTGTSSRPWWDTWQRPGLAWQYQTGNMSGKHVPGPCKRTHKRAVFFMVLWAFCVSWTLEKELFSSIWCLTYLQAGVKATESEQPGLYRESN